ncbi:Bacterial type II secretion system protein F domain protein [Thalassoglobus neptunius]|uniref:Bacterial type II secretion system protein F domain protein n=1 Tax=Thalassoglobus neptunius TaxID=1938619 RepID=A0A5C5X7T7_9PLAN|nr:type II secretion system F family protein [Thalassoglobus neptunius]TWT58858.1 Bacterial type II secretion system protein F domain protein [Thalassoglobus neptunius]
MLGAAFAAILILVGFAAIVIAIERGRMAETSRRRLLDSVREQDMGRDASEVIVSNSLTRRYRWLAILAGVVITGVLYFGLRWPLAYCVALGVLTALISWQVEEWWAMRRLQKAEQQLADSIDMMVAAVKSGSSLQGALESAMENTGPPWKLELQEVVGRIRFGDDPIEVLGELSQRVPLETVRLFSQTLAVNWTVGGRLALTLANVGRTIRDRLELSNRMHAMTTQARLSVVSVIGVTYFIAAMMWRNDPDRMADYLQSFVGQGMVATAIVLQAVGIIWISRLSRPQF